MTDLLLNVRVDGGIEIILGDVRTRVRAIRAGLQGTMHIRVAKSESLLYSNWARECTIAKTILSVQSTYRKPISLVVGDDTWEFEGCCPTAISADCLDIVMEFDLPKKNGRTVYAKTDEV